MSEPTSPLGRTAPAPLGGAADGRRHRARRTRPLAALVPVLAVIAVGVVACSGDDGGDDQASGPTVTAPGLVATPPPSLIPAEDASQPTIPAPDGFVLPDTRNASLAPVLGREPVDEPDLDANLVPVRGGEATVTARVVGPDGKGVGGATVRFERFVGPFKGWEDVEADDDGRAVLRDARGGRFRVRAWEAPRLTTTEPQLVFLRVDEPIELQVRVEPHESVVLQGALTSPTWRVGDVMAFEALLLQEEVATDGIIRGRPLAGVVTLAPIAGAGVDGDSTLPTDPVSGRVVFPVRCGATGIHQAVLSGNGQSVTVLMPECLPAEAAQASDPVEETTTTTTAPPDGPTTTTTTPEPVTFPVGRTFTVPFEGPLPAGTYAATGADSCVTSYEVQRDGRWVRRQTTGTALVVTSPVRSLEAAADTDPCTFRRVR